MDEVFTLKNAVKIVPAKAYAIPFVTVLLGIGRDVLASNPSIPVEPLSGWDELPVSFLPDDLRSGEGNTVLRKGFQKGLLFTDTSQKQVRLMWAAGATVNQPEHRNYIPSLEASEPMPTAMAESLFATRYYPNAICRLGSDRVLVAGVTSGEGTVIERWDFTWPDPMQAPSTDENTGITKVDVVEPARSAVNLLYRKKPAQGHYVRALCELQKESQASTHALVMWDDDGSIDLIDLESGAITSLASGSGGSASLVIPVLETVRYNQIAAHERIDLGYVYELYYTVHGRRVSTWPLTVLLDLDRDGVIDEFRVLDETLWQSQGWNDSNNYVNPFMR